MSTTYPFLPYTNYPDSLDSWDDFIDIQQSDASLLRSFQNAMLSGNFSLAQSILSQIPNSTQKIFTATIANSMSNAIMAIERFYNTDIYTFINNKQTEWNTKYNQFNYVGIYDNTITYLKNNIILYQNGDGEYLLYLNIFDGITPVDTNPENTIYWRVFTVTGLQGEPGDANSSFFFSWNSSKQYYQGNLVSYENALWFCLQDNIKQIPIQGSSYWKIIMIANQIVYPMQENQPTNQNLDDLWFQIEW